MDHKPLQLHEQSISELFFLDDFPIKLSRQQLEITRQEAGKSADVYKVLLQETGKTFAVKVFEGQWQKREIDVYRKYLEDSNLGTPKMIYGDPEYRFLVLEWLEGFTSPNSVNQIPLQDLAEWITRKYEYFVHEFADLDIDISESLGWLLRDPVGLIIKSAIHDHYPVLAETIGKIGEIERLLLELTNGLPVILDHGDLEIQNLLQSEQGDLVVIDWANAAKLFGMFDFAQFKKHLVLQGRNDEYQQYETDFVEATRIPRLSKLISLFAVIKEIQLIAYYIDSGRDLSTDPDFSSSLAILSRELATI